MKKNIWVEWIGLWGSGKTTSIENLTELFSSSNHKIYSSKQYFDENKSKGRYEILRNVLSVLTFRNFVFIVKFFYLYFPILITAKYKNDIIILNELRSFLRCFLARIYFNSKQSFSIYMWEGEYHLLPILKLDENSLKKFILLLQDINRNQTNIYIVQNINIKTIKKRLINDHKTNKNHRFSDTDILSYINYLEQFELSQKSLVKLLKDTGNIVYQRKQSDNNNFYKFLLKICDEKMNPSPEKTLNNHFICVGAQRSGTTSFYNIMKQHPDINMSMEKEVHFFDIDSNYQKGLDWYYNFFDTSKKITGECTPDYLIYSYVPSKIKKAFSENVKLIFILRNPILRAYSQFNFHKMKGKEKRSDFIKAMQSETIDKENSIYNEWYHPPYYLSRSLYFNQIERYYQIFDKDNLHFVLFEDLFGPQKQFYFDQILDFLDLKKINLSEVIIEEEENVYINNGIISYYLLLIINNRFLRYIKSLIPIHIKEVTKKLIYYNLTKPSGLKKDEIIELNNLYFKDDILKLERLINRDLSSWLK